MAAAGLAHVPEPFLVLCDFLACVKLFSLPRTKFLDLALLLLEAGWLGVGWPGTTGRSLSSIPDLHTLEASESCHPSCGHQMCLQTLPRCLGHSCPG